MGNIALKSDDLDIVGARNSTPRPAQKHHITVGIPRNGKKPAKKKKKFLEQLLS